MVARVRACVLACLRAYVGACLRACANLNSQNYTETQRSMHYNIFSLQGKLYFFIPTQHWISGSGADPFAALVISTPVSNFTLNSETTCSYLFILLKISIGTHLELLKLIQYTFAVYGTQTEHESTVPNVKIRRFITFYFLFYTSRTVRYYAASHTISSNAYSI
jgi:hypothetical protein